MSARERPPAPRINSYHGAKRSLLGNQAGNVPPAWRSNKEQKERGSKILLSRLPADVGETEVEELFKKTIGPLKECFLIYNNQGRSKGMAVITFQRLGDAAAARAKYDGKFIDGRRPIKIETIVDSDHDVGPAPPPPGPSLLGRIGEAMPSAAKTGVVAAPSQIPPKTTTTTTTTVAAARTVQTGATHALARRRTKKGPRRLNKAHAVRKSLAQLDQDMEEYKAAGSQ